jgi:hypothetical protein
VRVQVTQLRPGLWRWTTDHPEWSPGAVWAQEVGCTFAALPDAIVLLDPLVPREPAEADRFNRALARDVGEAGLPVFVLLTVHWHERSAEAILERYGATLWRPEQPVDLPEGVNARLVRGADWVEALFYLTPWRALVMGDLLVGVSGGVRVPIEWFPTEEQDWARSELREKIRDATADLDVELLLVSHGEPVLEHGRDALDRALEPTRG